MEYCCLFWVDLGIGVIRFEQMLIRKCCGSILWVILLQEKGNNLFYIWYHYDHDFTISGEVKVLAEGLMYFPTGELNQIKTFS